MKYKALFTFTQHSRAVVEIEADSRAEAEEKADAIAPDEIAESDYQVIEGQLEVEAIHEPACECDNCNR
ncbi:MAG TPA: hypothetical protein VFB72_11080 [Verrucomicrobiae bacterium]|nr:hypothetical protein [Verrucomicrobiae bacterium]